MSHGSCEKLQVICATYQRCLALLCPQAHCPQCKVLQIQPILEVETQVDLDGLPVTPEGTRATTSQEPLAKILQPIL